MSCKSNFVTALSDAGLDGKASSLSTARVYIIPTQHFDLIWRLPIEEYREIRKQVISSFLDLLDQFPSFKVTLVQAMALRWFLEDSPGDRDRLVRLISEGRLEVALGGLSLVDLNLVCGESIVRNLLYGTQWLESELGAVIRTANFADAFGINGQMPQIIRGFGLDSMTGARMPQASGKAQYGDYGAFLWEGFDGSKVLVYQDALGKIPIEDVGLFYGWGLLEGFDDEYERYLAGDVQVDLDKHLQKALEVLDSLPGAPIPLFMGGETHMPNPEIVEEVLSKADAHGVGFATQSEYIDAVRGKEMPVLSGEFNPQFTGCYSSRTGLKQSNRRVERLLLTTEMLDCVESAVGVPCDNNSPRELWERLAFVQFHDSLGGCHDDGTFTSVRSEFDSLESEAKVLLDGAMERLASRCDTRGTGEEAMVIFNPSPHHAKGCVCIPDPCGMVPVDEHGVLLPAQRMDSGTLVELPLRPGGTSVFQIVRGEAPPTRLCECPELAEFQAGEFGVRAHGSVLEITDVGSGKTLLNEAPGILLIEDTGPLWAEEYTGRREKLIPALVSYEEGSVASKLVFSGQITGGLWEGFNSLESEIQLLFFHNLPKIAIKVRLRWTGNNTKLMLHIPLKLTGEWRAIHSVPFGSVERSDYGVAWNSDGGNADATVFGGGPDSFARGDWPVLHWVDVRGDDWGYALVNDGTQAYRVGDDGIDVGLLRSGTAHGIPHFPVKPGPLSFENGDREFDFVLVPHRGDADAGVLDSELFLPPVVARTDGHRGFNPRDLGIVEALPGNVSVSCVKTAEDNSGAIILRLYEVVGKQVEFEPRLYPPVKSIYTCDMRERVVGKADRIILRPYEICTLRLELQDRGTRSTELTANGY